MKKINIILPILVFVILFIIGLFLIGIWFGFIPFGINHDVYNGKKPTDKEPAFWCSKDGQSWFEVKEDNPTCFGELNIDGKAKSVCYVFENYNRISIIVIDSKQLNSYDCKSFSPEETESFYGVCEFKETEVEVEVFREDENKKITFYKMQR